MLTAEENTGRVLVVEDDVSIADVLRRTLRQEGHEVRSAADGVEALRSPRTSCPISSCSTSGCPSSTASRS